MIILYLIIVILFILYCDICWFVKEGVELFNLVINFIYIVFIFFLYIRKMINVCKNC